MDSSDEIDALTHAISTLTARNDVMSAVLAGVLEAAKGNPDVAKAVAVRLQQEYNVQRAKPQSDHYLQSFEVMREYFRVLIE
jgi:hypothetical protein